MDTNNWLLIAILVFGILILVSLGFTTWRATQTKQIAEQLRMLPFSASYGQDGLPEANTFLTSTGQPQISCPSGYKVNIIGAFSQVYDPYASCSQNPSPLIVNACDLGNMGKTCKINSDCGGSGNLYCDCQGTEQTGCGSGVCKVNSIQNQPLMCQNLNSKGQNITCLPGASGSCAPRDATPFVSRVCNGQQSCVPNLSTDVGPFPCSFPPSDCNNITSTGYCSLPYTSGTFTGNDNPTQTSFNQGYQVSGIYSCVPDNQTIS